MTENQKKNLLKSFELLSAGARRGRRMIVEGKTDSEIRAHVKDLRDFVGEIDRVLSVSTPAEQPKVTP